MTGATLLRNCSEAAIAAAARQLREGHLVAFPTETVYGLGADATQPRAVDRIFSVKGRPKDHPLIVHLAGREAADAWARHIPAWAEALTRRYWPGPLTLVLARSALAADAVTGGQDTVGLRVPAQPLALALLGAFARIGGLGVAAPSANRFGHVSPTSAHAVLEDLGPYLAATDTILDGGPCAVGVESTIVDATGELPRVLRPGAITAAMIGETTGLPLACGVDSPIRVPGALPQHYAPRRPVRLDIPPEPGDGFIALASIPTPEGVQRLAAPASVEAFAQALYAALREGDARAVARIVVSQPPAEGLGLAIRDRLARAAAGT